VELGVSHDVTVMLAGAHDTAAQDDHASTAIAQAYHRGGPYWPRFVGGRMTETVFRKMATIIEIHQSTTAMFWMQVSLCCKKQTTFSLWFRHYQLKTQTHAKRPAIGP